MQQDVSYLAPQQELSAEMITQLAPYFDKKRYSDCWRKPYDTKKRSKLLAFFGEIRLADRRRSIDQSGDTPVTKVGTFISQADLVFPQLDFCLPTRSGRAFWSLTSPTKNVLLWLNKAADTTTWLFVDPSGAVAKIRLHRATI